MEVVYKGMLLKEKIKLYNKEDLKLFAYNIGLTKLSRLRKDDLVDAIVERLLDPDVMFYRMSIFDNRAIQLFEKGIGEYYTYTEDEFDDACVFNEMDFAVVDGELFYVVDDVAEIWKKIKDKKYESYRKRASWVWKCLYWTEEMYGFTPIEHFIDVVNTKKGFRMTVAELVEIYNHFPEDRLWSIRLDDIFLASGYATNQDALLRLRRHQADKDYYIPTVSEVEELFKTGALLSMPAYQKMRKYIRKHFQFSAEELEDILLVLWEKITSDEDMHDIIQWVLDLLVLDNDAQLQEVMDICISLMNGTRIRYNRGHTSDELRDKKRFGPGNMPTIMPGSSHAAKMLAEAAPKIEKMGFGLDFESNATNLQVMHMPDGVDGPVTMIQKKVYPNDPCPCGSGKKYKKCCGRR